MGRIITVKEAAERIGLSDKTVYAMIADGTIPGYKLRRSVRVDEDELEAYLESRRVRPSPAPLPPGKPGRPKGKRRDPRWYDAPESEIYTGLSCLSRYKNAAKTKRP